MASSQPIAFPSHPSSSSSAAPANAPHYAAAAAHYHEYSDAHMGSYSSHHSTSGSFNPASYYRVPAASGAVVGSPLSFRGAGSFGSRFYPGCSPGALLGPLDPNEFKINKMSSSLESDRGSVLTSLNFDQEHDMCRNFTCCGLQLSDMHALVDHFEEVHVVVVDPYAQPQHQPHAMYPHAQPLMQLHSQHPQHQQHTFQYAQPTAVVPLQPPAYTAAPPPAYSAPFDPDDMELDGPMSSDPASASLAPTSPSNSYPSPSPPDTPVSTPLSAYPSSPFPQASHPGASYQQPVSAFDTTAVFPSRLACFPPSSRRPSPDAQVGLGAFNVYAGYSDWSAQLPGAAQGKDGFVAPLAGLDAASEPDSPFPVHANAGVTPALLFSPSNSAAPTPSGSRVPSPTQQQQQQQQPALAQPHSPQLQQQQGQQVASATVVSGTAQSSRASTTLSRPSSSLLLSKPFKCPKPNCSKSYKQANGLKYHMTHGSCSFTPPPTIASLPPNALPPNATEAEAMEEMDRRLRPFACGVGDCTRRYKNMNGLRYHYQHSGEHGAIGLRLLASGMHECLQGARGGASRQGSRQGTPAVAQVQQQQQQQVSAQGQPAVSRMQSPLPSHVVHQHQQMQPSQPPQPQLQHQQGYTQQYYQLPQQVQQMGAFGN